MAANFTLEVWDQTTQALMELTTNEEPVDNPLDVSRSPIYQRATQAIKYMAPIMFIIGTVGNILAFLILWVRKALNKNTTTVYLLTLAFLDQTVLCTGLVSLWLTVVFPDHDYKVLSNAGCKVYNFLITWLIMFEPYVLINVSLERVVAVYIPHKSKILFTKKKALIGILITAILTLGLHVHYLFSLKLYHVNVGTPFYWKACGLSDRKYYNFMRNHWGNVQLLLGSAIPFCILFVLNILILVKVFMANQARKKSMNTTVQTKMSSMTVLLLVISFSFLAFSLPFIVANKLMNLYINSYNFSYAKTEVMYTATRVCLLLFYVNYISNFYLYCISSPRFRKELVFMFTGKKAKEAGSAVTATSQVSMSTTQASAAEMKQAIKEENKA